MKETIIPEPIFKLLLRFRFFLDTKRNASKTTREIFTQIYRGKKWGGPAAGFRSGSGSAEESVVRPYISKITEFLKAYGQAKPRLADLGCGNFEVGKNFIGFCSAYTCADIVPDLIRNLQASGYPEYVRFVCLDIVRDSLPDGDICFLRQVLQHLSNEEIARILPKLERYKAVFITEHYPKDNQKIVYNKDISHGHCIRAYGNSGVYLDKPPFNIPSQRLGLILEVPGVGLPKVYEQGVIRTYKLEFKNNINHA